MKLYRSWAVKRGCAVVLASALAATPVAAIPAFAENAQAPATQQAAANETAKTTAMKDAAGQTVKATTQADLDNAAEGSTVELKGIIKTELTVNKKLTITAAKDTVMKSVLNINANSVTVSGVHFALDGTTGAGISIRDNGKTGLNVKGCTFDLTSGEDALGEKNQPNCVWLGYGADDATLDGNTFNIYRPGIDSSYVGINIVGATVKNTTISNNTVSFKQDATPVASAHFIIANGNKSDDGVYGLSGLKVTGNTVSNESGVSADKSNTYGIGVSNVEDAVISDNTFNGLYMAVKPSMWPNEAPSKSIKLTSNDFGNSYVGIMMRAADVEPGAIVSTKNNFDKTSIPYAGHKGSYALVWQSEDGSLYPDIANAVSSGKTSLTLVCNLNLGSYANVSEGQNVAIDLVGHKLNGSLTNNGTLTIKDSAGLDGIVSSIMIGGTGKTTIIGGTFDSSPYDKGSFGENSQVADGHGVLVHVREDDGSYKYAVLSKEDVLAKAESKVETEDGTLFFESADDAKAYAEKNGLDADAIKSAKYTVSFDTHGNGNVDSITVESGKSVKLPAVPEVSGYKDGAWYNGDKKVEGTFTPTSDITLAAKWAKITNTGNDSNDANKGNNAGNNSGSDNSSKSNYTKSNAAKGSSLPQTGDNSAVAIAAAAATGLVAVGTGAVTIKRHHNA